MSCKLFIWDGMYVFKVASIKHTMTMDPIKLSWRHFSLKLCCGRRENVPTFGWGKMASWRFGVAVALMKRIHVYQTKQLYSFISNWWKHSVHGYPFKELKDDLNDRKHLKLRSAMETRMLRSCSTTQYENILLCYHMHSWIEQCCFHLSKCTFKVYVDRKMCIWR